MTGVQSCVSTYLAKNMKASSRRDQIPVKDNGRQHFVGESSRNPAVHIGSSSSSEEDLDFNPIGQETLYQGDDRNSVLRKSSEEVTTSEDIGQQEHMVDRVAEVVGWIREIIKIFFDQEERC